MKQEEKNRLSREKIIQAAIEAFANNDFEKVSQNEFCRKYDISKGKLYHYYSSKEDLYYSCINDALCRLADDMNRFEVDNKADIADKFHHYYQGRISYWIKHPNDLHLIKYAIDNFDKAQYSHIKENHTIVRSAMRSKTLEMLNEENISEKISLADLYEVMQLLYEKTFMHQIWKIIRCIKKGDLSAARERETALLDMYDKLIYIMLHGILS